MNCSVIDEIYFPMAENFLKSKIVNTDASALVCPLWRGLISGKMLEPRSPNEGGKIYWLLFIMDSVLVVIIKVKNGLKSDKFRGR